MHQCIWVLAALLCAIPALTEISPENTSTHTNNWAVLVCTSRFWFNYRHIANTLSFYYMVKKMGIPDSNIILMLPDDIGCNPRNPFPAHVFNNAAHKLNVYGSNVEVDYRGYDVSVETFIRLMTDRLPVGTPQSRRLRTDKDSNLLVFLTGHGGDGFIKFQDAEELTSQDVGDIFQQMHEKGRYNEVLFMVDTCQAATLYDHVRSPNIVNVASSVLGESSYSVKVSDFFGAVRQAQVSFAHTHTATPNKQDDSVNKEYVDVQVHNTVHDSNPAQHSGHQCSADTVANASDSSVRANLLTAYSVQSKSQWAASLTVVGGMVGLFIVAAALDTHVF
ncbi:hypothetical protein SARC_09483 [Sphaeroforma arctica JP610]|uniref:GPI-anchor transamidase n=1 Tax=Sphaeroforma arctica JP610 TaxID=667725 RepID=A0A0L0FMU3_9EUKA|nr:hypothetical protein SARC_09483 [Sphaeroforma arctica JP610]KNC78075.1 hypothetical protein SARC_09483 [Sphaeroforma arctica JP610]|eukprot:XP_014151977.1 hypothetical protein SARC_09483 [Sphaeroforma arctica JP610]